MLFIIWAARVITVVAAITIAIIAGCVVSAAAVSTIVAAEAGGVRQIWMGQPPNLPDAAGGILLLQMTELSEGC